MGQRRWGYVRLHPLRLQAVMEFSPPPRLVVADLTGAFREVLARLEVVRRLPKIMFAKAVSIKERIGQMRETLLRSFKSSFSAFRNHDSKIDTIISFLALLELVKQRAVAVNQTGLFQEIDITLQKQS